MDINNSPINLKLKKATSELLLLNFLYKKDMYGYQLASEIKKQSQGLCTFKESSMYPILNRLLEQHMITASSVMTENKKIRVYYHLEDTGKKYYEEMKECYRIYTHTINQMLDLTEEE